MAAVCGGGGGGAGARSPSARPARPERRTSPRTRPRATARRAGRWRRGLVPGRQDLPGYRVKAAPQRGAAGPASAPRSALGRHPARRTPGHTRTARRSRELARQTGRGRVQPSSSRDNCPAPRRRVYTSGGLGCQAAARDLLSDLGQAMVSTACASELSAATGRNWWASVRTISASTCASAVSLLAPDTVCRSRYRATCSGLDRQQSVRWGAGRRAGTTAGPGGLTLMSAAAGRMDFP